MNIHKNARLTPRGRVLMVQRIEAGLSVRGAADEAGISARAAHRWLQRWRRGDRQLNDRSSAPHRCPQQLTAGQITAIEQLRRQRQTGPAIAQALGMARSTVGLVLRRLGLNRLDRLEPRPPVIRYERQRPGEMLHLDIKKLGKINGIGHRFALRGPGMHANRGHGWDFLHVAIDDASRLAYTEILPSEGKDDTTAFLTRTLAWFGRLGVSIERVMTDNGSAYRRPLRPGPPARRRPSHPHPALHPAHQWQGRALHPDLAARVGLCQTLSLIGGTKPRSGPLDQRLQPHQTPRRHRRHHPWQRLNNLLGNDN